MARGSKPIHVPRTPRSRLVIDGGPPVPEEGRKDLSPLQMPFEPLSAAQP